MKPSDKRVMKVSEIPAFVEEVIQTGCDTCAVDHDKYLIGDADLSPAELETVLPELDRIEETYGDRDFLKLEIVAYSRSIGRYLDSGSSATHWSEKPKARH